MQTAMKYEPARKKEPKSPTKEISKLKHRDRNGPELDGTQK